MSGIKEQLFEIMESEHLLALARRPYFESDEEELTQEESIHQRSAERAGDEALDTLGR